MSSAKKKVKNKLKYQFLLKLLTSDDLLNHKKINFEFVDNFKVRVCNFFGLNLPPKHLHNKAFFNEKQTQVSIEEHHKFLI